jgi:hypothetical protein
MQQNEFSQDPAGPLAPGAVVVYVDDDGGRPRKHIPVSLRLQLHNDVLPISPKSVLPRLATGFAGLLLWVLSTAAPAAPAHYDESVSGDLPDQPTSAFLFDVGANTISGNTFLFVLEPGCDHFCADFDGFAFVLPEFTQLVDVSLSFTLAPDNVSRAEADYELCPGLPGGSVPCSVNPLGEQSVSFLDPSPVAVDFGAAMALASPGTYTVSTQSLGIAPIDPTLPEGWSADYTWTFRVEAIPSWRFGNDDHSAAGAGAACVDDELPRYAFTIPASHVGGSSRPPIRSDRAVERGSSAVCRDPSG